MRRLKVLTILTAIVLITLISGYLSTTSPVNVSVEEGQREGTLIFTAGQGESPLKGVEIKINEESRGRTDSDGILSVEWLLAGEYSWSAIYNGNLVYFENFTIPEVTELEFVEMRRDKDAYHLGDDATGIVIVKNTGTRVIDHLTIKVTATNIRYSSYGTLATKTMSKDFETEIYPGEEKEFRASVRIPESVTVSGYKVEGHMLKGIYKIEDEILIDDLSFGVKEMMIEVK
ncbi:MAG: hypothetical protein SVM80_04930 [Halobacteriota archaeon]|nr:hypothetical protein [Halobacteriota archaeon]